MRQPAAPSRRRWASVIAGCLLALSALVAAPAPVLAADPVEVTTATSVTAVSAGGGHTCAIKSDGTLACWGDNNLGQASAPIGTFTAVSAGGSHTCAIRDDGTVACWGYDYHGQATPPAGTFTAVDAGWSHTCAIRTDDTLACWGEDYRGQATPPAGTFTAVSAGGRHTCAIKADGTLACWGSLSGRATPSAGTFTAVSAGGRHTCAIRADSTLACWGEDYRGQATPPAGTFTAVSAGAYHTCAIRNDGTVACWGENSFRQSTPGPAARWTTVLARWSLSTHLPLAWEARPGLDPVASYDVRYKRARWNDGFGAYVTWAAGTTDTSRTFHAALGATYCFRVRARDTAGGVWTWSDKTCTAVPLDDRSLTRYGRWTAATNAAYLRGTYLRSSTYGASLTRTGVEGRWIALVATTCPTCGTVNVYWGSRLLKTISLHSDTTVTGKLIGVRAWYKVHHGTLRIKVVSSGKKVIIDGLAISRVWVNSTQVPNPNP